MNVFLINLVQKYGKRFRVAKAQRFKVFYAGEGFLAESQRRKFLFFEADYCVILSFRRRKPEQ
ncbi:hypothetical protein HYN56_21920 [Flavobacterium crocinum]|uniref:Uncharacterized protein n=1 Tax=Flavobacterium crocinum TaxID=2183896 RepID=A0A2S1YRX0_9FLAO|nr:hypothetical protein HYN56_21920 [Flavobacterium crocinum]